MRKRVYEYIKKHTGTDLHTMARFLEADEKDVLSIVLQLLHDKLVEFADAIPLDCNNDDSMRYKVTGKDYYERAL